jgi:glycosyltransferase involved in cell wall biosynthesis
MLSHPYLEPLARNLPSGVKLYYDSHNTEFQLKQALYRRGPLSKLLIRKVRQAETSSARRSAATFCVSDQNRSDLSGMVADLADRSVVCPNGVDTSCVRVRNVEERRELRRRVGFGREFVAVFLGSGHPPNAEAARLIIETVARSHPRVLFLLVGSVSGWFWNKHLPGNVMLMGIVSQEVKDFLLEVSDFALNPMLTGSGTSLKLFDYMAAGLPVLSTEVGARGLDEEAMKAVVLLPPEGFAAGLRELLADPERCAALSTLARQTAEQRFDWRVTLEPMVKSVTAG